MTSFRYSEKHSTHWLQVCSVLGEVERKKTPILQRSAINWKNFLLCFLMFLTRIGLERKATRPNSQEWCGMRNQFENKYVRKIILAEVACEGKTTQNQVLRSLCVCKILTGEKQESIFYLCTFWCKLGSKIHRYNVSTTSSPDETWPFTYLSINMLSLHISWGDDYSQNRHKSEVKIDNWQLDSWTCFLKGALAALQRWFKAQTIHKYNSPVYVYHFMAVCL